MSLALTLPALVAVIGGFVALVRDARTRQVRKPGGRLL